MPVKVRQALISCVEQYARYPDPKYRKLRTAIALHENVPEDWVLCGNGAADFIYRLCYAINPRKALICSPAFSEYERALVQNGCEIIYYTMKYGDQFALTSEIEHWLTSDIDIVFLCHPNNPTGRLIPKGLLEQIIRLA